MRDYSGIYSTPIPKAPSVYAFISGGAARSQHIVYVGSGGKLRDRISQHLEYRNSSVTTGASPVSMNPELIGCVWWWLHDRFENSTELHAAELIAFDVLKPTLRSRGNIRQDAAVMLENAVFREEMETLFRGTPSGECNFPSLEDAMRRIEVLEDTIENITERIAELER